MVEELDVDEVDSERTPRHLIRILESFGNECMPVFESVEVHRRLEDSVRT